MDPGYFFHIKELREFSFYIFCIYPGEVKTKIYIFRLLFFAYKAAIYIDGLAAAGMKNTKKRQGIFNLLHSSLIRAELLIKFFIR